MTDWVDETAEQIQRSIIPEKIVGTIVVQELQKSIAFALREAVDAETERCAKLIEANYWRMPMKELAAAIREKT